jgi:hypothetical protein
MPAHMTLTRSEPLVKRALRALTFQPTDHPRIVGGLCEARKGLHELREGFIPNGCGRGWREPAG